MASLDSISIFSFSTGLVLCVCVSHFRLDKASGGEFESRGLDVIVRSTV